MWVGLGCVLWFLFVVLVAEELVDWVDFGGDLEDEDRQLLAAFWVTAAGAGLPLSVALIGGSI